MPDSSPPVSTPPSSGRLLGLLVFAFYALFTLLPDSHSLMVSWHWVLFWQVSLAMPVVWLAWQLWDQRQFHPLGNGLDWLALAGTIGILLSCLWAEFPNQARWYGWAALCMVSALYAINQYLGGVRSAECGVQSAECGVRSAECGQPTNQPLPSTPHSPLLTPSEGQRTKDKFHPPLSTLHPPFSTLHPLPFTLQGALNLTFILLSLWLWGTQTVLPELERLRRFREFGVNLSFDLNRLELRNWAPIGHQNYVAGYLLLAIPLLAGLAFTRKGWQRWLWSIATGLGLLDLYTTNSRGGWLGLIVMLAVVGGMVLWRRQRWLVWVGLVPIVAGLVVVNDRLRSALSHVLSGQGSGEIAFRMINAVIGWRMGRDHPWFGSGLGSVPLLYQHYRPTWAGREGELAYQLHSTPVQLWAELGIWGTIVALATVGWLAYLSLRRLSSHDPPTISLLAGLLAYSIMALTDYQLDNLSISGTIVLYLALLATGFRCQVSGVRENLASKGWRVEGNEPDLLPAHPPLSAIHPSPSTLHPLPSNSKEGQRKKDKGHFSLSTLHPLPPTLLLILLLASFWLFPIHRAWNLSSQGFNALSRKDINLFVDRLEQANRLAPWEPYYANQLGWTLGNLGLETSDPQTVQAGIRWLQRSLQVSPYQEFATTNLGWLLLTQNPAAATQAFQRSATLVPAKRGTFYGLGISLLRQEKTNPAIRALVQEVLRDPQFITSPLWRSGDLQPLLGQVLQQAQNQLRDWLQQPTHSPAFTTYVHQVLGALAWWQEGWTTARAELSQHGSPEGRLLVNIEEGKPVQLGDRPLAGELAIAAWAQPTQRDRLLTQAWITATHTLPPPAIIPAMVTSMNQATSLHQWLSKTAPTRQYRRERSGFGVLSRHIDGPIPRDFLIVDEIVPVTLFFSDLFPNPTYLYDLDRALADDRQPYLP